eukprot:jgi/Mesvir1/3036/Mv16443-RA.1
MTSAMMTLKAKGAQDIALIVEPKTSFFHSVWLRHSNFSWEDSEIQPSQGGGKAQYGNPVEFKFGRSGDLVANYDTVYGSVGATVKPELNTAGVSPDVNKIRQIIRSNFIAGRVGNEMSQVIAETGNQQWVNHVIENAFYSDKITNLTTTVTPPSGLTDGTLTIQFEIADYNLLVGGVRVFKLLDSMISKADKFTFNRTVITANDRAADNATIFYYGNGTEGFGLFHTNGGLLKLKVTSGSADNIMSVTGAVVGDGKWHNLILTRVAAAANSARWKLWVDGVEHSSSASPRRRSN